MDDPLPTVAVDDAACFKTDAAAMTASFAFVIDIPSTTPSSVLTALLSDFLLLPIDDEDVDADAVAEEDNEDTGSGRIAVLVGSDDETETTGSGGDTKYVLAFLLETAESVFDTLRRVPVRVDLRTQLLLLVLMAVLLVLVLVLVLLLLLSLLFLVMSFR